MELEQYLSGTKWLSILDILRKYKYFTLAIFIIICAVDKFVYSDRSLTGLYIILMIITGITFHRYIDALIMSIIAVTARYYLSPFGLPSVFEFIIQWFSYLAITLLLIILIDAHMKLSKNQINLLMLLSKTIDSRDNYTAEHSYNVATYSRKIAMAMGFSERYCNTVYIGGLLHDLGKVGINDELLRKPLKLTNEEFNVIKGHPQIGYDLLKHYDVLKNNEILDMILYHHERYDGKGYPNGLAGEVIPLSARIIAVADTFDAITSNRTYREKKDFRYAAEEICKNSGTQFDPGVVIVFLDLLNELQRDLMVGKHGKDK